MTTTPKNGIVCEIYRNTYTKGGTLRDFDQVLLLIGGPFEPCKNQPAVKLVKRHLFGRDYYHAEPVEPPPVGEVGYMAGGTLIYSCDSRFRNICDYPIVLHDHTEVPNYASD